MKIVRFGIAAGAAAALGLAAPALADDQTGTGSSTSASTSAKEMPKELQEAAQKLHAANQDEIEMAKHAQQMAQSPQVKKYARMLGQDHQKNDRELETLARKMGVELNGEAFQDEQKKSRDAMQGMQSKQGAEFDKWYVKEMVEDHEKDIEAVKDAAKKAHEEKQTQLASFLDRTRTRLEAHLHQAKQLEKTVDRQVKSGGSSSGTGSGEK